MNKIIRSSEAYSIPGILYHQKRTITTDIIINIICEEMNISIEDILSRSRKREYCLARNIYVYYLRTIFKYSLEKCGIIIKRNYCSIINNMKQYTSLKNYDNECRRLFVIIDNRIKEKYNL